MRSARKSPKGFAGVVEGGVVVVTGAAGTVGQAVIAALVKRGAEVLAIDLNPQALEELRADEVELVSCDVTDSERLRTACLGVQASRGPIVGFYNNAGIEGPIKPVHHLSKEDLAEIYEVNIVGVLVGMRIAIELMLEQGAGGRILNQASGAGLRGTARLGAYVSSKHAVVGLTRCAALEVADAGIAVNALCPGCIESPMMHRVERALGADADALISSIPAGRYADVSEIAETAAWLLLEAPLYLTGAALPIDGGWAAG
jgi:3alpha(or 20beta)-hydroxysteroid dehydrogenase